MAVEKKQQEKVDQYEQASRFLRHLREIKAGTAVFLVSEDMPVTQELSDPARLFDQLRIIDENSELNEKKAVRNVEIYLDLVSSVKKDTKFNQIEDEDLKDAFNYMTLSSQDKKLEEFKNSLKDKSDVISRLRVWDKIKVIKERGKVSKYNYTTLQDRGILLDDPDTNNVVSPFCCFPMSMVRFMQPNEVSLRKMVFFFLQFSSATGGDFFLNCFFLCKKYIISGRACKPPSSQCWSSCSSPPTPTTSSS